MNERQLITEFVNLTQLGYGLFRLTDFGFDTKPKTYRISAKINTIENHINDNIRKMIKTYLNDKTKPRLRKHILTYLTDNGSEFLENGGETRYMSKEDTGGRGLEYCVNPLEHGNRDYWFVKSCCYDFYKKELEGIDKEIEERTIFEENQKRMNDIEERAEIMRADRRARFAGDLDRIVGAVGHKNKCYNCLKGSLFIGRVDKRTDWNEVENLVFAYEMWCVDCCGGEENMNFCVDNKTGMADKKTGELIMERKCECGCWDEDDETEESEDYDETEESEESEESENEHEEQLVFKGRAFE